MSKDTGNYKCSPQGNGKHCRTKYMDPPWISGASKTIVRVLERQAGSPVETVFCGHNTRDCKRFHRNRTEATRGYGPAAAGMGGSHKDTICSGICACQTHDLPPVISTAPSAPETPRKRHLVNKLKVSRMLHDTSLQTTSAIHSNPYFDIHHLLI